MKLFNRPLPSGDVCEAPLRTLSRSSRASEDRAVACNLVHDHRVDAEREAEWRRFLPRRAGAKDLKDAVKDYRDERVRYADSPDFADDSLNGKNFMRGPLGDNEMATVIDLTGLAALFRENYRWFPSEDQGPEATKKSLDRRMRGSVGPVMRRFVASALELMNGSRPFNPVWVMPWTEFATVLEAGATRWCEAVGRPIHDDIAHWVIVLRYRLREAGGSLVAPTTLDAGLSPEHFPPPLRAGRTGIAMDLQSGPPDVLRSEAIHPQTYYRPEFWEASDFAKGEARPSAGRLVRQRTAHYNLLCQKFGSSTGTWMKKPI